jgi:hypothetical protein
MNIHEKLFVKNFIIPRKRERYLELLGKEKTRDKILDEFRIHWDLVEEFMALVPPNQQFPENVYKILKSKGAPEMCYIISNDWDIDGKELPLTEALEKIVKHGSGTFVSCVAGKLGYFESDEATDRYILEKK